MSTILFVSAVPGDACLGIGAYMASLTAGRAHHVSLCEYLDEPPFGVLLGETPDKIAIKTKLVDDTAALSLLGADIHNPLITTWPQLEADTTDDAFVQAATRLRDLVQRIEAQAIVLPAGLEGRRADLVLQRLCQRVQPELTGLRWATYVDQPYALRLRGRYPELAFARRVRGLAEIDEDPGMLSWKPLGSPTTGDALTRKLEASLALPATLLDAAFFQPEGFELPSDRNELRDHIMRVLGQREWLQLWTKV